jgi:putative ABC transport system substrate-binding protein
MRELGYVEGKDFIIEWRSVEGRYERFPELAAELLRLKVDVFVTGVTAALPALKQVTSTIPIVMAYSTDPVGNGLVASLVHPGGNITGLTGSSDDSSPKQLELLATIVPNVSRIGLLGNPDTETYTSVLNNAQAAAQKVGLSLVPIAARNPREIEEAFAAFAQERVQAVMVAVDAVFFGQRQRIAELALSNRLATMFRTARVRRRRRADELWREPCRFLSPRRLLRGQDFQGCKARRFADRAADQVPFGDQPQDRRRPWRDDLAAALHLRR